MEEGEDEAEGALCLAGAGGEGLWEASLMELWQEVLAEPEQMAKAVLTALGSVAAAWGMLPEKGSAEEELEDVADGKEGVCLAHTLCYTSKLCHMQILGAR
jgi:hypothetical protein